MTIRLMWIVAVLGLLAGVALAEGFDGLAVTLADNTSLMLEANVAHRDLADHLKAGKFEAPAALADRAGIRARYFDHNLLLLLPVKEREEVEAEGAGRARVLAVVALFPKPADFNRRWPLQPDVPPGVYFVIAAKGAPGGTAYLVTVKPPHRGHAVKTRHPEYGQTPGAMVQKGEVHPYVTQIGRGCVFGVGLAPAGEKLICVDLVR